MTENPRAPIDPKAEMTGQSDASIAPLSVHLGELRHRVIRTLVAIILCTIIGFVFSVRIIEALLWPLVELSPDDAQASAIFTSAMEVLFVRLDVAVWVGIFLSFPFIAWNVWSFAAPGLYGSEKRAILPIILSIPFLTCAGLAMVYYLVLPIVVRFAFSQEIPSAGIDVAFLPRVREYIGLAMGLFKAFALAFQLPVVLAMLARAGLVSAASLAKGRKYALVAIFAIAMFLTPPDPFSQTLLAIPVYILYEAGVLAARLARRRE